MKIVRDDCLFEMNSVLGFRDDCTIQETSAELVERVSDWIRVWLLMSDKCHVKANF